MQVSAKSKPFCGLCLVKRKDESEAMKEDDRNDNNSCKTAWENLVRPHIRQKASKGRLRKRSHLGENQRNRTHHSKKEIKARVRQVLVGNPACVMSLKAVVRWTPAPKFRGDPSKKKQTLSNEEKDMKDYINQNVCSTFWKHQQVVHSSDNFPENETIWSVFLNGCMWPVFYLQDNSDESSNSRNTDDH